MGFADVTDNIRQMAGRASSLRVECGCWSGAASASQEFATQLTHVVGGIVWCHDHAFGHPVIGSANQAGTVDVTLGEATGGPGAYWIAGW
jgi:hypothetical protein